MFTGIAIASIATTRAGNLHTRVLANAIADLPLRGKSIIRRSNWNFIGKNVRHTTNLEN